jgi:hypothetical protein
VDCGCAAPFFSFLFAGCSRWKFLILIILQRVADVHSEFVSRSEALSNTWVVGKFEIRNPKSPS